MSCPVGYRYLVAFVVCRGSGWSPEEAVQTKIPTYTDCKPRISRGYPPETVQPSLQEDPLYHAPRMADGRHMTAGLLARGSDILFCLPTSLRSK